MKRLRGRWLSAIGPARPSTAPKIAAEVRAGRNAEMGGDEVRSFKLFQTGSESRRKALPWLTKPLLRKAVFRRFDQISGQNRHDLNQYLRVRTQNQSGRKAASTAPGPGTRRGNFA